MPQRFGQHLRVFGLFWIGAAALLAQSKQHYTLILEDPPMSERYASREQARTAEAQSYGEQIQSKHETLKSQLASLHIQVTAETKTVLNAVFVVAPSSRLDELKALPGVKGVVAGRTYHLNLNKAVGLVNAPAAWTALGGVQNAGAGIKIAMIDTGIDQTHPAFQDSTLTVPAGFPICKIAFPNGTEASIANCSAYTNHKVIVARSYAALDAAGSDPANPAPDSTPDDYTPRDRVGHGTGTGSAAAGVSNTGPEGITFNGVAPKAFLGNYKVFGSPGVNGGAADTAIILAIEDAQSDGMDVASMSLGGFAFSGPLDSGPTCGLPAGVPCDPLAAAVENAIKLGMVIVIAAGNDGDGASSSFAPTLSSVGSPGYAPSAITVGSTTNSHFISNALKVSGSGVPANLQAVPGNLGNGPAPNGQVGPLVDVTTIGDSTGLGCNAFAAGSLKGSFALIERGTCSFAIKVTNAQSAGAIGVVLYMADGSPTIVPIGLGSTTVPAIMIANAAGVSLKSFIDSNSGVTVNIPATAIEIANPSSMVNLLSFYSSSGPATGTNAIKPDLVATGGAENIGGEIYLAAQDYDPLGELFSANRYTSGQGTSFSTPLVSGAAALVKQAHPKYTPAQIKSALVNNTAQGITADENGDLVGVPQLGAGLLNAGAALQSSITVSPATLSFGVPTSLPAVQSFQVTNNGSSSANLTLVLTPAVSASGTSLALDHQSFTLAPGATQAVNLTITGTLGTSGSFSGFVTIQGGASPLYVPYMFLVGSPAVANFIVLSAPADTLAGQDAGPMVVRLVDASGVGIPGLTVSFTFDQDSSLKNIQSVTNANGIASAEVFLGNTPGTTYNFSASLGRLGFSFQAAAIPQPRIASQSVLNGASFMAGQAVAPGSYISIFGSDLSTTTAGEQTTILPLTIDGVTASFDVPAAQLSLPGYMLFVSPGQVNLQVPWELQGQSAAQVKVSFNDGFGIGFGNVVTVQLAAYSPAFFEISGQVAAEDANGNVLNSSNPAVHGTTIQLFANGLGPVSNQPASGDPAPSSPLAMCSASATVTIGTTAVTPGFCGLAPGFAGLYQLNVPVPSNLAAGSYPITVAIGGQTSKASMLSIK